MRISRAEFPPTARHYDNPAVPASPRQQMPTVSQVSLLTRSVANDAALLFDSDENVIYHNVKGKGKRKERARPDEEDDGDECNSDDDGWMEGREGDMDTDSLSGMSFGGWKGARRPVCGDAMDIDADGMDTGEDTRFVDDKAEESEEDSDARNAERTYCITSLPFFPC